MGIIHKYAGTVFMTWAEQDILSPGQESLDEAESHGPAGHGAMEEGTRVKHYGCWHVV